MTRWRRGLFGLVGDIIIKSEEDAREQRNRENILVATMGRSLNYQEQGYSNDAMGYPNGGFPASQGITLADAVKETINYALDMSTRMESPDEGALRPDDQLRKDYLTFLGYLHNPASADPVQQVKMINVVLGTNLTSQVFFQLRNVNSLVPEFPKTVPESLKYFVQDDMTGGSGPITSGFCMSRFLVNTYRELGQAYIAFGGVSEQEIRNLTEYIIMLNDYLREKKLFHTMDPFRKGENGKPYFGLPVGHDDEEENDIQSHGIDMPGMSGLNKSCSDGIDMPKSDDKETEESGGIDFSKGIDMPSSLNKSKTEKDGSDKSGSGNSDPFGARGDFSLGGLDDYDFGSGGGLGNRDDFDLGSGGGLGHRDDFDLGSGGGLGHRDDFDLGSGGGLGSRD